MDWLSESIRQSPEVNDGLPVYKIVLQISSITKDKRGIKYVVSAALYRYNVHRPRAIEINFPGISYYYYP